MAKVTNDAPVFDREALIKAASTFGTTPEVMAGALHGVTDNITKDQAEKKLKDFLTRPVKYE